MIYIKAPTQLLRLAFAQNIMWYGISLDCHCSKTLRLYCRWEIPVAYLMCFVCINDCELHRIQSLIRSKDLFAKYLTWDAQQGKDWAKILEFDVNMLLPQNCSPIYNGRYQWSGHHVVVIMDLHKSNVGLHEWNYEAPSFKLSSSLNPCLSSIIKV